MKKLFLILTSLLFFINLLSAQNEQGFNLRNSIYLELLGSAGVPYSINYERNIISRNLEHNISLGFGTYEKDLYIIPMNYLFLLGSRSNHLEFGLNYSLWIEPNTPKSYFYYNEGTYTRFEHRFSPIIGYRYQKKHGKFLFKITFSPRVLTIWDENSEVDFILWGGIGFGYRF